MQKTSIWTNKYFVATMAVLACALWGSAFPVLKLTYLELGLAEKAIYPRLLLAGSRFLLASILLFLFSKLVLKHSWRIEKRLLPPLLLLGTVQTGLQYFFFYNGLALTSGAKSAVLEAAGNFFAVIAFHFIYSDDRLNLGKIIGLVTGFAGIILVNWQGGAQGPIWGFSFRGEGFMLLAGLFWVFSTIQAKSLGQELHPVLLNAYQMLFGSAILLVAGYPGIGTLDISLTPKFWLLFLYSAILSATAFSIWYTLLTHNRAGEVTLYRFAIPIFGSALSVLILPQETFSISILLALFLVAFGLIAVNYWGQKAGQNPQQSSSN